MSNPFLRPLLWPCLALFALALPLSAQLTSTNKHCEPRIDVNRLPRQGNARHYIAMSGNYVVTAPIRCNPGETAIEIGPNASSVTIDGDGFMIMGDQASSVSALRAGIIQPARAFLSFSGAFVSGFSGDALSIDGVDDLVVSHVTVLDVGGTGLRHGGGGGAGKVSVHDLSLSSCATGMHVTASDLVVRGAALRSCGTGMIVECPQFDVFDTTIFASYSDGMVIDDSGTPPGVAAHRHRGHVTILKISGGGGGGGSGGHGIVMRSSGAGPRVLVCEDVSVSNCAGDGLLLEQTGSGPGGGAQVTLRNSSFSSNGGSGVKRGGIGFTFDTTIFADYRGTFSGNGQHGLDLADALSIVQSTGSSFDSNAVDGVHIQMPLTPARHPAHTFSSGSASNNGQDGVSIVHPASGNAVSGDVQFRDGLRLCGNGRDGAHLVRTSSTGGDVTLQGNLRHGFYAESSTHALSGLRVSDSGSDGFHYFECFLTAYGIAVGPSGGHGFQLTGTSSLKATDCTITGSQLDGVHSVDGDVTLARCNIGSSGQDGVDVSGARLVIEECVVSGNGGSGVAHFVAGNDPPEITSLTRCTVSDNGVFGVACSGKATPKLWETCCKSNVMGGLSSRAAGGCSPVRAHVEQCTFESNGGTAIDVQNPGGGLVARCVVSGSATGLHVGDSSGACSGSGLSLTDNSITECGTGLAVEPNGKVLVVRNYVSSCTVAAFAVGQGNLLGPVVSTSIDLGQGSSPHSNYAP